MYDPYAREKNYDEGIDECAMNNYYADKCKAW
jgi:hypothetical protein